MQCRSVLTRIDARRTGELDPRESHQIEEHLESCPSCEESVEDLEMFAGVVRSLRRDEPAEDCRLEVCDSVDSLEVEGETVWVGFTSRGMRMIDPRSRNLDEFREAYRGRFGRELRHGSLSAAQRKAIAVAVTGRGTTRCEVDLSSMTDFEREVLRILAEIPRGEVRPYSWLAAMAKRPGAVRAVGNVMARNPLPFVLPCHRVVPSGGGVGNYAFGDRRKRALLEAEGVETGKLDELARRGVRFVGSKTTGIFCFPTCRDARRIREENRVELHDAEEAHGKRFRACRHCMPLAIGA
ncbi:MAG TPA: methylated-DNA--[protein]-cysteine S-methyltransferase [Thermoanaerobaculia bacterium]|nr:methylated-DNA--[protein]-cysteine S-methyltransferase [Thermoanaerobaculia bacterium]